MTAMLDCDHSNDTIQKRLEGIYALHTKKMDFRLDIGPYRDLLVKLGNPQNALPKVIHVAGTNGKGSTIAFLKSMAMAAGLRVHTYTSPHLIEFNERISLAGQNITNDQLMHYMDIIDAANNGAPLTFFEYTTALALKAMADIPADLCLIETGLGGRLDCTNVIDHPVATIITSIGYDHTDWLGDTIDKIAMEKAGIMKKSAPCFVAPQCHDGVIDTLCTHAQSTPCDIFTITRDTNLPPLGLIGDHQMDNASVAVACFKHVFPDTPDPILHQGLSNTKWPARMECLSTTPDIWFDCGHNPDGANTIAQTLQTWKTHNPIRPIHIILGLANDKNAHDFVAPLWGHINGVTCVDLPNARNPQTGKTLYNSIENRNVRATDTIENALQDIVKDTPDARILICGSLYLYDQAAKAIQSFHKA